MIRRDLMNPSSPARRIVTPTARKRTRTGPSLPILALALLCFSLPLHLPELVVAQSATPVAGRDDPSATLPLTGERRDAFIAFIEEALAVMGVPGASLAVVQNGETVLLEGFGAREVGTDLAVTPDTMMAIGSVTKPLTSLLAATLVEDGFLSWTMPIIDLLPEFQTGDPALTEQLTVADLFCACSGIPSRDEIVFWNSDDLDVQTLIGMLAKLSPTAPIGERFQYSNLVYAVGGYAAAVGAGSAPHDLKNGYQLAMRNRVFNPAGMSRSTFDVDAVLATDDYALPHATNLDGEPVVISLLQSQRSVSAIAPAAGLWSTGRDLASLLHALLNRGIADDGRHVVSPDQLEQLWEDRVTFAADSAQPSQLSQSYGLGWFIGEVDRHRLLSHSGQTHGFVAQLSVLPEADLGIAILTNATNGGAFTAVVQQRLFELIFDLPPNAELELERSVALIGALLAGQRPLIGTIDRQTVAPFLGRYCNPTLGGVTLRLQRGKLIFDAGEVRSELRPLLTRPNPDPRYLLLQAPPTGLGSQVVLRYDAAGRPELVLPAIGTTAIAGETLPTYVFVAGEEAEAQPALPSVSGAMLSAGSRCRTR